MNIEIANRLVELRKKSGLSQEELADKLGLSRQAVSKWERAEASPDTDNLICLANLYHVSLDDLLRTDVPIDEIVREQKERSQEQEEKRRDHVSIGKDGIHVSSEDGDEVHISKDGIHIDDTKGNHVHIGEKETEELIQKKKHQSIVLGIISSIVGILALISYLLIGFLINTPWTYGDSNSGWAIGWIVFLLVPVIPSIFEAISKRRVSHFALPPFVAAIYLFVGMYFGIWHPTWVVFLSIPVFYMIVKPIEEVFDKKDKEAGKKVDDDDDEDDDD